VVAGHGTAFRAWTSAACGVVVFGLSLPQGYGLLYQQQTEIYMRRHHEQSIENR
jgi:hypothetical protein